MNIIRKQMRADMLKYVYFKFIYITLIYKEN